MRIRPASSLIEFPTRSSLPDIRIYAASSTSTIVAAQAKCAAIFANRKPDADITFGVSADGSRIWFSDASVLGHTSDLSTLPQDAASVERAVRKFIGRVNFAIYAEPAFKAAGIKVLFPDDLRSSSLLVVTRPRLRPVGSLARAVRYLPANRHYACLHPSRRCAGRVSRRRQLRHWRLLAHMAALHPAGKHASIPQRRDCAR
jgi:hypothetical protein